MGIHSIIVIKNKKGEYLQYFDQRWNCYLFLNCKLPNGEDSEIVKEKISEAFNISTGKINVVLKGEKRHRKFSESAMKEKEYTHLFYEAKIGMVIEDKSFNINGIQYKWFSYSELLQDERIKKVNYDIIEYVKEFEM